MQKLLFVTVAALMSQAASAAVTLTGVYAENFDSLSTTTVAGQFSNVIGTQNTIPGLTSWDGAKFAGTGASATSFIADNGGSNTGSLFSYGATGSGERALGALASGTNIMAFGVKLVNGTADNITSLTIDFTAEQWRSSTVANNKLAFAYGTAATDSTYLTAALTAEPLLDALAKPFVTGSNAATNGNDAAFQTAASATINVLLTPGQAVYIRWSDANDGGNDAGIAVDNLTIRPTFVVVPEPTSLAGLALAGLAAARRRRA